MPIKRKAAKQVNKKEPLVDVMGCVDMVSTCLERAEHSSRACLDGIMKAEEALLETKEDSDIRFAVLIKRAELLFIAAKNNYNLDSLPGSKSQYSLECCVTDCERVLNDISSEDIAGKQMRATAKAVCSKAQKLLKDREYEEKKRRGGGTRANYKITESTNDIKRYDPSKTCFKTISKINQHLLQDIVDCYKHARNFCRTCYYRRHVQEPVISGRHCRGCKKIPQPLMMIPASKLCENLSGTKYVAVPPPPKMMMQPANKHRPFQICKNQDHKLCDDKATVGENWFAHSIEELVIWTVQRHYGCKFQKYIQDHHRTIDPPNASFGATSHSDDGMDTDDLFSDSYSENNSEEERFDYYPDQVVFAEVADIPQSLLLNIIEKYRQVKEYCKRCFYKTNKQGVAVVDRYSNRKVCSICGNNWNSIRVMPASELCWNFGDMEFLPIAEWPLGKPNKDPFEYCKKKDHNRCFRVYTESDFWYPHSVEEMVVWTVEREKDCSFDKYIEQVSAIPASTSGNAQRPAQQPQATNYRPPSHPLHPQLEDMNFVPSGAPRGPRPPLLSTPMSGNPQPPVDGIRPGFPSGAGPVSGPGNGSMPPNMPYPPPGHFPPASDFHMNNGGGGRPMMYLSQPPGPMFPHQGRPVLLPRMPSMVNPHGGLSQQPVPTYPGPNPPRGVMGVPPQTMYNPYGMVNHSFNVPMYPPNVTAPPRNDLPVRIVDPDARESERAEPLAHSSPVVAISSPNVPPPETGATFSTVNDTNSSSPVSSVGKASTGRRNYRVARSPSSGVGSVSAVSVGKAEAKDNAGDFQFQRGKKSGREEGISVPTSENVGGMSSTSGSPRVEVKAVSAAPILATRVEKPSVFKFSEVNFSSFVDIPPALLHSIAQCFQEKITVCRKCFYGERSLSTLSNQPGEVMLCSTGEHRWLKPVDVIPGCSMCNNEPSFQPGEHVPVPPLPPVAILKKCSNRNHHKCFTKCLNQDPFQAHSVEELVVWIVESEKDCSFEEYARDYVKTAPPPGAVMLSPKTTSVYDHSPMGSDASPAAARSLFGLPIRPSKEATPTKASPSAKVAKSSRKYHPKDLSFVGIKDIPSDLLHSVAECYKDVCVVCRICFFESNCSSLSGKKKDRTCKKDHIPWKPIRVIPRSPLCATEAVYVPLPPLPKHMRTSRVPFVVCKKADHKDCFAMSKGTNPWFPHTAEELVVWTVERECALPFDDVYTKYLPQPQNLSKESKKTSAVPDTATKGVDTSPTSNFYSMAASNLKFSTPNQDTQRYTQASSPSTGREAGKRLFAEALSGGQEFPLGSYKSRPSLDANAPSKGGSFSQEAAYDWGEADMLEYFRPKDENKWWSPEEEVIKGGDVPSETNFAVSACNTSYTMDYDDEYPVQPPTTEDYFIHQSQVETDPFQPYAGTNRSPMLLIGNSMQKSSVDGAVLLESASISKSKEIQLEERDWEDSDDVAIEEKSEEVESSPAWSVGLTSEGRTKNSSNLAPGSSKDRRGLASETPGSHLSSVGTVRDTELPWGDENIVSGHQSVYGDGGGLWSSTSWGDPTANNFITSAFTAADSVGPVLGTMPAVDTARVDSLLSTLKMASNPEVGVVSSENGVQAIKAFANGAQAITKSNGIAKSENDIRAIAKSNGVVTSTQAIAKPVNGTQPIAKPVPSAQPIAKPVNGTQPIAKPLPSTQAIAKPVNDTQAITKPVNGTRAIAKPATSIQAITKPATGTQATPGRGSTTRAEIKDANGGKFFCLLCYSAYKTAGELFEHCSTDVAHQKTVMLDTGADRVWQHTPPPPKESSTSVLEICMGSSCGGPPICKLPHSQEELREWLARWNHRDQCKSLEGNLRLFKVFLQGEGVPITSSKVLQATVSEAVKIDNNCYRWDLTIQGKNWLNLFGVTISTTSSWIFKITHIEEPVAPSIFHPHSPSWTAPPFRHTHHLRQSLLLGLVEIKVKAIPPSNKKEPSTGPVCAEVRLDLGFKQFYSIPLQITTEVPAMTHSNGKDVMGGPPVVQPSSLAPPTFGPYPDHSSTFSPQHQWRLSQHSSSSSDDLGSLNMEGEELTLQHVPIEDWGYSLTDDQSQNRRGSL